MKSDFIVCGFVTRNTCYEKIVKKYLLKSLKQFDIPFHIEQTKDLGSWIRNTSQKPSVILKCLDMFPDKNIVYLDADCSIKAYPSLFNEIPEEYDMGVHYLDLKKYYDTDKEELLSSVLFLRNKPRTYNLIKKWKERCGRGIFWEQRELEKIVEKEKIDIYELPFNYSHILSLPKSRAYVKFIPPTIVQCPVSGVNH